MKDVHEPSHRCIARDSNHKTRRDDRDLDIFDETCLGEEEELREQMKC